MPAWFINLAIGIFFTWVSWILRPSPTPPKATTIDDFKIPIAEQGQEIGKIYGTVWINSHVHWYGDFRAVPIRESQGKKG